VHFGNLFLLLLLIVTASAVDAQQVRAERPLVDALTEMLPLQGDGLSVRFAKENWTRARELVATDPAWGAWAASRTRDMDTWMLKDHDRADWVPGYPHDLVDPVTRSPLRWKPDMERPALTPGTDKFHAAWVSYVREYNLDRIQDACRLFRLSGDSRYAEWAVAQLDFYAAHYSEWPLQQLYGSRSRMLGQGLDEATVSTRLIDAVRLLGDFPGAGRRKIWRDKLFLPIVSNLRTARVGVNNISLWHRAATAMIGLEFDDEALYQEALGGPDGLRAIMKVGVTSDFIWYEGSLSYQTYVLRALTPLFVETSLHGRGNDLLGEMLQAQNMLLVPFLLRFENGMLPNPGDTTSRLKAVDLDFLVELYRALPTPIGMLEASRRRNWEVLLDPPNITGLGAPQLPVIASRSLPSVRMALLKSPAWQVFFRYGQVVTHHSHGDALNTEIYFEGVPVSTDPGTVLYGSELHNEYFSRSIAHNVALVDGQGQLGWDPGVLEAFDAAGTTILASQPRWRPDASVSRGISIAGVELVDRLSIRLDKAVLGARRLGFLFHTDCDVTFDDAGLGAALPAASPSGQGFKYWHHITVREMPADAQASLRCDGRKLSMALRTSAAARLFLASVPSTPLPKRRLAVYVEVVGRDAYVETRFQASTRVDARQ
jgi:hypothetical protein